MPRSTQRWSDRRYVPKQSAVISWDVSDATSELDAINAVAQEWAQGFGATHPLDARMRAGQPDVSRAGLGMLRVTLNYTHDDAESDTPTLDEPPTVEWDTGWSSEQVDRDIYNNPILNAAGDAPDSFPPEEFPSDFLTYTRPESTYDLQKNLFYRNTICSNQFLLGGKFIVFPGQCRCISIAPSGGYDLAALVIRIAYRFEFRAGQKQDGDGWDGFKRRFLNQGETGWWKDTIDGNKIKKGRLLTSSGERVASPQRLRSNGMPYDTTLMVESAAGTANAPVANPITLPTGVTADEFLNATFLKYVTKKYRDFSGIFN